MLFIGAALVAAFVVWEWKGAKYPMVPKELFAGQRVVAVALAVAFVSGMNFYSMINFAPLTYATVFDPEYVSTLSTSNRKHTDSIQPDQSGRERPRIFDFNHRGRYRYECSPHRAERPQPRNPLGFMRSHE